MSFNLTAYGLIFSEHSLQNELENSNKTLLPAACIPDLDLESGTTYVEIINPSNQKKIVCAVHEYTESPGIIFIPSKLMNSIDLDAGYRVEVNQKTDIEKGEFIKIKPFQKAFIELADPKVILEKYISQYYPILSQGEIITINYNNHEYNIEVTETRPNKVIQTTNCDINVDFERPVDMVDEPMTETKQPESKRDQNVSQYKRTKEDLKRFPGKGYVLGRS